MYRNVSHLFTQGTMHIAWFPRERAACWLIRALRQKQNSPRGVVRRMRLDEAFNCACGLLGVRMYVCLWMSVWTTCEPTRSVQFVNGDVCPAGFEDATSVLRHVPYGSFPTALWQVYTGNCKQFPEGERRHGIGTYDALANILALRGLLAADSCTSCARNGCRRY